MFLRERISHRRCSSSINAPQRARSKREQERERERRTRGTLYGPTYTECARSLARSRVCICMCRRSVPWAQPGRQPRGEADRQHRGRPHFMQIARKRLLGVHREGERERERERETETRRGDGSGDGTHTYVRVVRWKFMPRLPQPRLSTRSNTLYYTFLSVSVPIYPPPPPSSVLFPSSIGGLFRRGRSSSFWSSVKRIGWNGRITRISFCRCRAFICTCPRARLSFISHARRLMNIYVTRKRACCVRGCVLIPVYKADDDGTQGEEEGRRREDQDDGRTCVVKDMRGKWAVLSLAGGF